MQILVVKDKREVNMAISEKPVYPSGQNGSGERGIDLRAWLAGMTAQGLATRLKYEEDIAQSAVMVADKIIERLERD